MQQSCKDPKNEYLGTETYEEKKDQMSSDKKEVKECLGQNGGKR